MSQPTLFDAPTRAPRSVTDYGPPHVRAPLARNADPDTSHRAAEGYLAAAEVQNAQIVAALRIAGPEGMTHAEIDHALQWPHPTAARRIAALRDAYELVTTERTRACEGHRPCRVHVAPGWAT